MRISIGWLFLSWQEFKKILEIIAFHDALLGSDVPPTVYRYKS
jgi:hypothetical protein